MAAHRGLYPVCILSAQRRLLVPEIDRRHTGDHQRGNACSSTSLMDREHNVPVPCADGASMRSGKQKEVIRPGG